MSTYQVFRDGEMVDASDGEAAAITAIQAAAVAPVVPRSVSNYQARTAMIEAGLFARADAALRGADQTVQANQVALAAWDYANDFYRTSPLIAAMTQQLGLTAAQVDALFIAASQIT